MFAAFTLLSAALLAAPGEQTVLQPWASKAQPGDVAKSHVEEVSKTAHSYTVVHGGNVDGESCRTPVGCGINREAIIDQSWQSNRAVRMENVGQTDLVNPWLSNGKNNFRNIDEIVASAITPGMTDRDKTIALWLQHVSRRFHRGGYGGDLADPVLVFNVYGHHVCGQDAQIQALYWQKIGLKSARVRILSHAIAQVQYGGGWHLMDSDIESFFLLRDNETVASDCELARDHDLVKRSHTNGLTLQDLRRFDENYASMFVCEDPVRGDRAGNSKHTMNMTLRPGEALTWRWGHLPQPKYSWREKPDYPDIICNGLWEFRPDFSNDLWKKGAATVENIVSGPDGLRAEDGKTGTIVWKMQSPYNYVGAKYEAEGNGAVLEVSEDGKKWVSTEKDAQGHGVEYHFFSNWGSQRFQYQLRCQLKGDARLKKLAAINDLQMHFMALPEMVIGENKFTYTDQSTGERKVKITHEWTERTVNRAKAPEAVYPPDGGKAEGTDFAFRWNVPQEAGGAKIVDAQFMLSDKADAKLPLSTNFYKLISRTADKAKPQQYTLPYTGLLTGGKQYYWRVRAKDEKGVFSPWSKAFSFTVKAPNYPLDAAINFDKEKGVGTLTWKANPAGEKPVKYRVYGSDEKGFSVSDEPYKVIVGASKELKPDFPANFIAETAATELPVLGAEVTLPGANKAYYRVVAVDADGKRSGPSYYAAAPRPVIYSKPAATAKVGTEYKDQVSVNRSLGDLRERVVKGNFVADFWDIERPKYAVKGPSWLKLDADTGALSGTPDAAGKFDVEVTATIDREVRKLDEGILGWGNEKVLSTSIERVGSANQRFVIEVSQ